MSRIAESHLGDDVYPNSPGFTEPTTSREAARRIRPGTIADLYEDIVNVVRLAGDAGLTADEAAKMLGKSVLLIRPRVTELSKHMNRIEKTGERRTNESGMNASVYRFRK